MENDVFDIIGIGESDIDIFLKVEHPPGKGEKVRAQEIGKLPGGIIGNFCSQAAKAGVSCGIVSVVGNDENGKLILSDYEKRGIDTTGIYVDEKDQTFYCVVFVDDSGEKYLSAVVTPLVSPSTERIDYNYVKKAKFVHMCSMDYHLVDTTIQMLEGSSAKVSLDYEAHADQGGMRNWEKILRKVSVLFINEEGLKSLLPHEKQEAAVQKLLDLGIELVILTCAEKGGYIYNGGRVYHYNAFAAECILDTTGAGDSFNGAFLSSLVKGMDIEEAAEYAAAAASFVIQEVGARTGQKEDHVILEFLQSKPKKIL